ncbi:MAG: tetratricopeptide repeat protein [Gammaproteobacteria bacterium]|nr:tetratricopeptide repeat protein [Gammaproteobacteria bacterium]
MAGISQLIKELRRRKVFRVAAVYAGVSWLLVEIASVVLPTFNSPEWILQVFTFFVILGFPLAVILAWAFDITPQGIKRDSGSGLAPAVKPNREEPAARPVIDGNSIAVLPLENLSRDPANEPFTIGIHDDLLTCIAKIGSIKTISRTSVMQYRDTTKTIPQIARELGVSSVLEGGVQRSGDRVHINVQLIDAATDEHLWAEVYDRDLTAKDIFAIQGEISAAIAEALRATLSPDEQDRLSFVPTENMAALEAYFLGKQRVATRTTKDVAEAVEHFQHAIELDPDFALAYVGLADGYLMQAHYGNMTMDAMVKKAEPVVKKALELDDRSGEAHTSLAALQEFRNEFVDSEQTFKRAVELNPNYATAHHWYGELLINQLDRVDEAAVLGKKAAELDPLSPAININLGVFLDVQGRFEEALAQYHRVIGIDPAIAAVYPLIGFVYWEAYGRIAEALPWFEKGVSTSPSSPNYPAYLGLLYLDLGDQAEAERRVNKAIELGSETYRPNVARAFLALKRGEDAIVYECAGKALTANPNVWWGWAAIALLRNEDLRAGRDAEARARYEQYFPALLDDQELQINRINFQVSIDFALVLMKLGEQERAERLLEKCLAFVQTIPRLGQGGYWIADAIIYALRGETGKALAALRTAIDEGWRASWWFYIDHDPNLDSIRDEAEFQSMRAEIEADMAAQLGSI